MAATCSMMTVAPRAAGPRTGMGPPVKRARRLAPLGHPRRPQTTTATRRGASTMRLLRSVLVMLQLSRDDQLASSLRLSCWKLRASPYLMQAATTRVSTALCACEMRSSFDGYACVVAVCMCPCTRLTHADFDRCPPSHRPLWNQLASSSSSSRAPSTSPSAARPSVHQRHDHPDAHPPRRPCPPQTADTP